MTERISMGLEVIWVLNRGAEVQLKLDDHRRTYDSAVFLRALDLVPALPDSRINEVLLWVLGFIPLGDGYYDLATDTPGIFAAVGSMRDGAVHDLVEIIRDKRRRDQLRNAINNGTSRRIRNN